MSDECFEKFYDLNDYLSPSKLLWRNISINITVDDIAVNIPLDINIKLK